MNLMFSLIICFYEYNIFAYMYLIFAYMNHMQRAGPGLQFATLRTIAQGQAVHDRGMPMHQVVILIILIIRFFSSVFLRFVCLLFVFFVFVFFCLFVCFVLFCIIHK